MLKHENIFRTFLLKSKCSGNICYVRHMYYMYKLLHHAFVQVIGEINNSKTNSAEDESIGVKTFPAAALAFHKLSLQSGFDKHLAQKILQLIRRCLVQETPQTHHSNAHKTPPMNTEFKQQKRSLSSIYYTRQDHEQASQK